MKRSTWLMLAGAGCIVIAMLGQVGPWQTRLSASSAVALIIGLAFVFSGLAAAGHERRKQTSRRSPHDAR